MFISIVLIKLCVSPKPEESTNSRFIPFNQIKMCLKQDDQVLVMFASLRGESEAIDVDLPVLCEFPNVFLCQREGHMARDYP